jgi:hydrogenase maturation protein HypF
VEQSTADRLFRVRHSFYGAVQGVGFRPWIFRLAHACGLSGWVANSLRGVELEVEGTVDRLERFLEALSDPPWPIHIYSSEAVWLPCAGYDHFEIRPSLGGGSGRSLVLPDIATCGDCLTELFAPGDRRYRYPFINCTHCGPRFSILYRLPYDRPNTTMAGFPLCSRCLAEFEAPEDRRFHAQPVACPACGPHLAFLDSHGEILTTGDDPVLDRAAKLILEGGILALKGLGGFQLLVDARSESAVARLRKQKHREGKPFALMGADLECLADLVDISPQAERVLQSPMSPIVLLNRLPGCEVATGVAPGIRDLGVMLPYTPLHHLLMRAIAIPVVATSGNRSGAPMEIDTEAALQHLGTIADGFLVHDRPIARAMDDSVVRLVSGGVQVLRRARGYAPLPLRSPEHTDGRIAVGGQMKNTVAISTEDGIFVSPHIGDLETVDAIRAHQKAMHDLASFWGGEAHYICHDLHPEYESGRSVDLWCEDAEAVPVQHHLAHIASVVLENGVEFPALGLAWDGTGLGLDGHVWGGEFFWVERGKWARLGALRPFRLPGGDAAIREPRRALLGMLHSHYGPGFGGFEWLGDLGFSPAELTVMNQMLERGVRSPWCTSIGRLFDAVSALSGICLENSFEGQAAILLEHALTESPKGNRGSAPDLLSRRAVGEGFDQLPAAPEFWLDWGPILEYLVRDGGRPGPETASWILHESLVEAALRVAEEYRPASVVLSGGCFQNRYLLENLSKRLEAHGFKGFWNQMVPPNDGCLSYGQIAADSLGWASKQRQTGVGSNSLRTKCP